MTHTPLYASINFKVTKNKQIKQVHMSLDPTNPDTKEGLQAEVRNFIAEDPMVSAETYSQCQEFFEYARATDNHTPENAELTQQMMTEYLRDLTESILRDVSDNPETDPQTTTERILNAFRGLANEPTLESQKLQSINAGIAKYSPNLRRIRELDLSPYDEMALLKSSALAGIVRGTNDGVKLAHSVMNSLKQEMSNQMALSSSFGRNDIISFIHAYQRSVFASIAIEEIRARQGSAIYKSVDDCLMHWDELGQVTQKEEIIIPNVTNDDGESVTEDQAQFRMLTELEKDARLKNLEVIGDQLKFMFGENCVVNYFETIVFDGKPEHGPANQDDPAEQGGEDEERDEENTGGLFQDYIVAEIIEKHDDIELRHYVAESIHPNNACYVLRADVLAEVSRVVGKDLGWRDVFGGRKNTARQLGAKNFNHTNGGTTIPGKVLRYFSTVRDDIMNDLAVRWTEGRKRIYDEELEATRWNRLPKLYRSYIDSNKAEVQFILGTWRKELGIGGTVSGHLGRIVTSPDTIEISVEDNSATETLRSENELLTQQLAERDARIQELEEKLATLRSVLDD